MTASEPGGASDRGAGATWLLACALVAASACAAVALDAAGRSARVAGPARSLSAGSAEVLLVPTNAAAVAAWSERGARGRVLVHAGRFLHFVTEGTPLATEVLTRPGRGPVLDAALRASANARNHLWIASETGIARRILFLPPPAALAGRLADLGATPASLPLAIPFETHPRTLVGALPHLDEPVLVEVNASWFDAGDAETLLAALRAPGLRTDLVVASLAEDADDVTPGARDALRRFASALQAPGPGDLR